MTANGIYSRHEANCVSDCSVSSHSFTSHSGIFQFTVSTAQSDGRPCDRCKISYSVTPEEAASCTGTMHEVIILGMRSLFYDRVNRSAFISQKPHVRSSPNCLFMSAHSSVLPRCNMLCISGIFYILPVLRVTSHFYNGLYDGVMLRCQYRCNVCMILIASCPSRLRAPVLDVFIVQEVPGKVCYAQLPHYL